MIATTMQPWSKCFSMVGDAGRTDLPDPEKTGDNAKIMLPDLLRMRLAVFLAAFVPLLVMSLFIMAQLAP